MILDALLILVFALMKKRDGFVTSLMLIQEVTTAVFFCPVLALLPPARWENQAYNTDGTVCTLTCCWKENCMEEWGSVTQDLTILKT